MDFIMEILLKNGAYAVMFVGVMAFLVSCITEVLKHITWLDKHVPTAAVVIVLSLVLCPVGFAGLAKYRPGLVHGLRIVYCGIYRCPCEHGRMGKVL